MSAKHRFVPVGTLLDMHGFPVTVRRDFTTLVLPDAQIERDQLPLLRKIIDDAEAQIIACAAELGEAS